MNQSALNTKPSRLRKLLVTGATGNVGLEVLRHLQQADHPFQVYAGVRDVALDSNALLPLNATPVPFDFEHAERFTSVLHECEVLFLLRPPQLAVVEKYFAPLVAAAVQTGVRHIVFLSVQGVEANSIIPHHKIERLIRESGIAWTFLRPAYFMQNFVTTLHKDLIQHQQIFLPAGKAMFTLVDVRDIGLVAAVVMANYESHVGKAYDLTSDQPLTFGDMAAVIKKATGTNIIYKSPNLLSFYLRMYRQGVQPAMILVMIMLHFFPRFQKTPPVTDDILRLTGKRPFSFAEFVEDYKNALRG